MLNNDELETAYKDAQLAVDLVEAINGRALENVASTTRVGSFDIENTIIELYGEESTCLFSLYATTFQDDDYVDEARLADTLKYYQVCAGVKEEKMFNAM